MPKAKTPAKPIAKAPARKPRKPRPAPLPEADLPPPKPRTPRDTAAAHALALAAARSLADDKCTDVVVLDLRGLSQATDFFVVASGTSDRQMRAAASHVRETAAQLGHDIHGSSADDRTTWVVLDCVDVVVHVFEPNTRAYYDLEMLWGDAPRLDWDRAADAPTPAAPPVEVGDDAVPAEPDPDPATAAPPKRRSTRKRA